METIDRLGRFLDRVDPVINLPALYRDGQKWLSKDVAVLGIISYQVATINILQSFGFSADFVIGHSLGEISAGYACGKQSEEETILIALVRSRMSGLIRPGFLLATENPNILEDTEGVRPFRATAPIRKTRSLSTRMLSTSMPNLSLVR